MDESTDTGTGQSQDTGGGENTVPYSRLKEVVGERNTAREEMSKLTTRLSELEKADKDRQDEDALKRGEHESVIEKQKAEITDLTAKVSDLEPRAKRADEWIEAQKLILLEKIPEDQREIYKDMPLEGLAKHLALMEETKTGADTRRPGGTARAKGYENPLDVAAAVGRKEITVEEGDKLLKTFAR